jgi:chemotaxis protein histidine kinase CheA
MAIATTIVNGCVQSNAGCKQYGDELTQYIAAQLVASATAKAQERQASADAAAAAAAASAAPANDAASAQLAAVQMQMAEMQARMEAQQASAQEQLQAALAAQQQQQAAAAAPPPAPEPVHSAGAASVPADVIESAVARGVSADVIARNQASGQILEQLENVSAALQNVKKVMQDVFEYAGCDTRGDNCTGPKRVAAFKQKANAFFDPFETVQDEVYDALLQAQALGVDISDIYMMLSSSCNVWGQYLCDDGQSLRYTERNAPGEEFIGKIIPMGQGGCQLLRTLSNNADVYQSWLEIEENSKAKRNIIVGCASDALDTSKFFMNRRKKINDVGIDDLALVLSQEAIVPRAGPPEKFQCYEDGKTSLEQLEQILMSNKVADSGVSSTAGNTQTGTPSGGGGTDRDGQRGGV